MVHDDKREEVGLGGSLLCSTVCFCVLSKSSKYFEGVFHRMTGFDNVITMLINTLQ